MSVLLHDFSARWKHLLSSSSFFESWTYICSTEVNGSATKFQLLTTSNALKCFYRESKRVTLIPENKGRRPVLWAALLPPTAQAAEFFFVVLGNILLQVKQLQRNSMYKAISCLLRVHPLLRETARTFSYQDKKGILFYLLSTQKTSLFFQESLKYSKSNRGQVLPIH